MFSLLSAECLFGQAPWASNTLAELAEKIKENKPIVVSGKVSNNANILFELQ